VFELKKNHAVMPLQRITLRPKGGLPMILRRRDRSSASARVASVGSPVSC